MITITYVENDKRKRTKIEGRTISDAIEWLRVNKPGVHIFRVSIINKRRA